MGEKPKMLFMDDRTKRIESATKRYGMQYEMTIVTNVLECLRYLSSNDYELLSLDCDLGGRDFIDISSMESGMSVVNYIRMNGWPKDKPKPRIIIHSSNIFGASAMLEVLLSIGFNAKIERYKYES